ncbi:hypothetical protein HPB51_012618 [Rhipicephalus microplus]|uniref:Uncharacterized protein n=1 Tax=Rhipicephalus microplus TaxID=6941 RepID=A0A9J6E1Y0_RHIMP|nr:hypothetical protein HPB51_012618 [Rhipicephalus microplus]
MVIVLSDGKISDVGTYDELLTRGGAFSDFLVQFLQEGEETEGVSDEDMQLLGEIVSQVGASTELARQYSRLSANESDSTSDTERRARRRRTSSTRSAAEKSIVQSKVKPEKTPPVAAGAKLTEEESAQVGSAVANAARERERATNVVERTKLFGQPATRFKREANSDKAMVDEFRKLRNCRLQTVTHRYFDSVQEQEK